MANVLYMAISRDGFIAGKNDETPWSDASWDSFNTFVTSCDVVLLGKRTYQIMKQDGDLLDGPHYIVVTHDKKLDTNGLEKRVIHSPADMPRANKLGIIGGGDLNGRLAKMGVIDEMILDVEPIELKDGIRLFGKYDVPLRLTLMESRLVGEATIQRHYRVLA